MDSRTRHTVASQGISGSVPTAGASHDAAITQEGRSLRTGSGKYTGTQVGPSLPSGDGGLSVQTPASGPAYAADRHSPVAAGISLGSVSASICEYLQMA